jgi:hypothetical protein
MYIRISQRKNKDGSVAEYASLAHNYRHPDTGRSKAKILYNFGRREHVDEDGLRRLVDSINRFLGPEDELKGQMAGRSGGEFDFVESRSMGGAWLLSGLWQRLGIGAELTRLAKSRRVPAPEDLTGRIFAMVANRALEPKSKHATPDWLSGEVYVPGVPQEVYDEQLYRAMDFLLEVSDELQQRVFFSTADLLNLEVDLLLYDTTSAYFEMESDDAERQEREARWAAHDAGQGPAPTRPRPQVVNDPVLRMQGYSRDKRPDVAQVVIGLAVTRQGIPVRCWVWPGNTHDATTVAQVKADLAGWRLNRVVWAVDRGMVSDDNLIELRRGGAHYVAGKKVRSGEEEVEAALARQGRYKKVRDNLLVKDVVVGEGEKRQRFVVVRNPAQEARDREKRERKLAELEEAIERLNRGRATDEAGRQAHTKAVCALKSHPTKGRFVRELKNGRLTIDRAAVKEEERLDGKYLVITSDDSLSAEDVALSYKQLAEVEAAWRTMKTDLDLRPMHHRKADRIRSHVLLCWLALLLVRVTEVTCEERWWKVQREMDRLHRGVFEGRDGRFVMLTRLTNMQKHYLKALQVPEPRRFEKIEPTQLELELAPS